MFRKTFICFVLVNFVSDSFGERDSKFFRRNYQLIQVVSNYYKISTSALSWPKAKKMCEQENATLLYPENDYEASGVIAYLQSIKSGANDIWVGLSAVNGVLASTDGKSVSNVLKNWAVSDMLLDGRDCVYMSVKEKPGFLGAAECDKEFFYICMKTNQSIELDKCNVADPDYVYNNDNGKCYKIIRCPKNWYDASEYCEKEMSNLAVVNNKRELDFLANLTGFPLPKLDYVRGYQPGMYHMGFRKKYDMEWRTVTDSLLKIEMDAWYLSYRPDTKNRQYCSSMFYDGVLVEINCYVRSHFICEYDPTIFKLNNK